MHPLYVSVQVVWLGKLLDKRQDRGPRVTKGGPLTCPPSRDAQGPALVWPLSVVIILASQRMTLFQVLSMAAGRAIV